MVHQDGLVKDTKRDYISSGFDNCAPFTPKSTQTTFKSKGHTACYRLSLILITNTEII